MPVPNKNINPTNFNAQQNTGATAQNVNVTDLICEGPIRGLVDGAASLYLDDVAVEDAKFSEFIPNSFLNGRIVFSGSAVGTVSSTVDLSSIEFESTTPRSLRILYRTTTATLTSSTSNNAQRNLVLEATSGTPFDSSWATGSQLSGNAEARAVISHPDISSQAGVFTITDGNTANFSTAYGNATYPTTGNYTISIFYFIPIAGINSSNNQITLATAPASGTYEFAIGAQLQVDDDGEQTADSSSVIRRISKLNIDFRRGDLEQPVTSSVGGVGGSVAVTGNASSVNLQELKIISQSVATSLGVSIFDVNGLPNSDGSKTFPGSPDLSVMADAATVIPSSAFGLDTAAKIAEADEIGFTIKYPALQIINLNKGDKETAYAFYVMQIRFKQNNAFGPYKALFPNRGTHVKHFGNTNAPVSFDHSVNLDGYRNIVGPFEDFDVRIARVTRHIGLPVRQSGTNEDDTDKKKWQLSATASLESTRAVIKDNLIYPYSSIASVSFSSKQFDGIPKRSYLLEGKLVKVPNTYTPREYSDTGIAKYTGFWNGDFHSAPVYTDNPAWVFYDLVTNNRYGAGKWIQDLDIDKYALYRIARYCDELVDDGSEYDSNTPLEVGKFYRIKVAGNTTWTSLGAANGNVDTIFQATATTISGTGEACRVEPRFRANVFLTKATDVYKVLKDFATIFLGILYWQDSKITPVQDAPQDPIYNFTKGNVLDGAFSYESSGSRTRINQVVVTWNDPTINYEPVPLVVEDRENIVDTGRIISESVVAFGATSESQAIRYGRWKLWTAQNQTEIISFKTSLSAHFVKPGDVINVQDADRFGIAYSGRTKSATSTTLTFDRNVSFNSGSTYELSTLVTAPAAFNASEDSITINSVTYARGSKIDQAFVNEGSGFVLTNLDTEKRASNAFTDSSGTELIPTIWKPYSYVEAHEITNPGSTTNVVTLANSATFDTTPSKNNIWGLKETVGGLNVVSSQKMYKILSITEESPNVFAISAVEYFNEKFTAIEEDYILGVTPASIYIENEPVVLPRPINPRIIIASDAKKPGEELVLEWDEPTSDADSIVKFEIVHNISGIESPIITKSRRHSFTKVPNGSATFKIRSISRQGNLSSFTSLEYGVYDPYEENIPRMQGGIPKGVISTAQGVIDSNNHFKFQATNTKVASVANPFISYNLTGTKNVSNISAGEEYYLYLDSAGPSLKLLEYDSTALSDLQFYRDVGTGNSAISTAWTSIGTVSVAANSNEVTGSGFNTNVKLRDVLNLSNSTSPSGGDGGTVISIISDTKLLIDRTFATAKSNITAYRSAFRPDYLNDAIFAEIDKTGSTISTNNFITLRTATDDTDGTTVTGDDGTVSVGTIDADNISANSITADAIAANSITTEQLAANSITANQIAANTITTEQLAANSITANQVAANTITTQQLAANSITANQIAANSIATEQLSANSITANQIASTSIVSTLIDATSVTASDIQTATLSALSANLGDITAGTMKGGSIPDANAAPGGTETGAFMDLTNGKMVFGNASKHILFDGSNLTLNGVVIDSSSTVNASAPAELVVKENGTSEVSNAGSLNFTSGLNVAVSGTEATISLDTPTDNNFTNTLLSKLNNIESGATGDQTAAEIRTLVGSATDSNVFTDTEKTKLSNIEAGATGDQTAAEIRTLVGSATDSNVFTDTEKTKLSGIASNANNFVLPNNNVTNATVAGNTLTLSKQGAGNVTFTNTDTTFSAGSGLSLSGTSFSVDSTVVRTTGTQSIGGTKNFTGDVTFSGNTTYINTTTLNIGDNIITLNADFTGSNPSESAGIEVERGTQTNKTFVWDESIDRWSFGSEAVQAGTFHGSFVGSVTGSPSSLSGLSTDDLAEGSTNLYFTNARARSAISQASNGGISYSSSNGEISVDTTVVRTSGAQTIAGTKTFSNGIVASGGLSGFTINNGISGTNFNISGVNALTINDPGEGIIFGGGSSGNMTLAVVDNASDNILRYSGTNAVFDVQGNITLSGTVDGRDLATDGSKLDGIASNANNFSLPTNNVTNASVSGSTLTLSRQGASDVTFTDTNTEYTVGDGGLTQKNFTTTLKNKLDGIAANATNTSQPAITSSGSLIGQTAAQIRTAIGAGTSNLQIGTTASTALAGNTTIPSAANNATITLEGGAGLLSSGTSGGGAFTTNQGTDETITFAVGAGTGISVTANAVALATAGAGAGTYGSTANDTKIDQITLDAYGRVTAVSTGPIDAGSSGTVTQVSVGAGLDVSNGTTTPSISLDLSELTSTSTFGTTDEFIVLDGNAERKITASEVINDLNLITGTVVGSLFAEVISANTINANRITANTITAAQIQADAITAAQINAGAITAEQLQISNNSSGSAGIFFDFNSGNSRIDIRDSSSLRVRIGYLL